MGLARSELVSLPIDIFITFTRTSGLPVISTLPGWNAPIEIM